MAYDGYRDEPYDRPRARGRGARGRQRNALRSPVTWVIVLGIALAGGAFLLWRRNQNANAANASTAAAPNNEDLSGQIATLQSEIANLQSTGEQGEGETGTGTGTGGGGTLTAPTGLSITPHRGFADFGWNTVAGAKAYELQVAGSGGRGTGRSHFDHAGTGNHAEHVQLSGGDYKARVRAGTSVTSLSGPWSAWKPFHVGAGLIGTPIKAKGPTAVGAVNGSGGESENDSGSG